MVEVSHGVGYVGTIPGVLKLSEITLSLLAVLLTTINGYGDDLFKAFVIGFLLCLAISEVLLILGLSARGEQILKFQFAAHGACFVFGLVVGAILVSKKGLGHTQIAGGAFGIITSLIYLGDGIHSFLLYRPL